MIESNLNLAVPTGDVTQYENNSIPEYVPELEQLYFHLSDKDHEFCVGLKDMLKCIAFAISVGELPELPVKWIASVSERYGIDYEAWDKKD